MQPRLTTLPSGLRVVTDAMPDTAAASVGFFTGVGTRFEEMNQAGLSHLLEHMFFKGTKTLDAKTMNRLIEDVGGSLNAWTARDQTAYYASVLGEDVPLALDLLADMMLNPRFDADDLEREKHVIAQEIGEAKDTPGDLIFDVFQSAAWPDQPLGLPVLGEEQTLEGITRQHLLDYVASHYRAESCLLIAAGAVDHEAVAQQAEKLFAALPSGAAPAPVRAVYRGGEISVVREHEQLHLCLGLRGSSSRSADLHAEMLFATALGGGTSSRLFHEVREARGLAYSVSASLTPYEDDGILSIYTACDPERAELALEVITRETAALVHSITAEELARAKALLRAGLLMEMDSSSSRAIRLASSLFTHGRIMPVAETLEKIAMVTLEDVRRVGARLLASPLTRATVGPAEALEPFASTVARLAA